VEDLDGQVLAGFTEQFGAFLLEYDAGTVVRVNDLFAFFEVKRRGEFFDVFQVLNYFF
jgi:hypothetical protein